MALDTQRPDRVSLRATHALRVTMVLQPMAELVAATLAPQALTLQTTHCRAQIAPLDTHQNGVRLFVQFASLDLLAAAQMVRTVVIPVPQAPTLQSMAHFRVSLATPDIPMQLQDRRLV